MDWTTLTIDPAAGKPVYQQLAGLLSRSIVSGQLEVGDALPTENALCAQLGISRSTVRQAFQLLEDDGLIVRKPRVGTRVCKPKLKRHLDNLYSFTAEMQAFGLRPNSQILRFERMPAQPRIAEKLTVPPGEPVYLIQRLRLDGEEPLLIETAYIPAHFAVDLSSAELGESLYAAIRERYHIVPGEAAETYEAVAVTRHEAALLNLHVGAPALHIERTSKNTAGEIFEYCSIIARGDRYKYQIVLKNSGIQYARIL